MVANGHLNIKLALKRRGMYHEKIGIFEDAAGDRLVFQGLRMKQHTHFCLILTLSRLMFFHHGVRSFQITFSHI